MKRVIKIFAVNRNLDLFMRSVCAGGLVEAFALVGMSEMLCKFVCRSAFDGVLQILAGQGSSSTLELM